MIARTTQSAGRNQNVPFDFPSAGLGPWAASWRTVKLLMALDTHGTQVLDDFVAHSLVCLVMHLDRRAHATVDADATCRVNCLVSNRLPLGTCEILGVLPPPFLRPF